ncbi:DNA polymerase III subunit gamma/tau [Thermosipho africanus]|uniref:DNA polymerase III subunit gamma/tau n=1 Tax=Thermosipho africanus TaxID=2421 RepID=UPI001E2F0773|nr:DNA polymerase III subunit gamma/tau [Thermosipho africanus]
MFAGPRGTGKTTTARILAKSLNCEKNQYGEPCNECSSCKAIDNGSHLDVIELDAASNRGIDEIRKIRDGVNFTPVMGKYKVYIIDEVHMLTREAFNALLKTLEEPPQHVVFILATTNPEKIPPTITSRCHVLEFRNISQEDIMHRLKQICGIEGYDVSEKALEKIAKRAAGGLRDALSILEQVVKYAGGEVTEKIVDEALGLIDEEIIVRFIDAILKNEIDFINFMLNNIYIERGDFETFINQLIEKTIENPSSQMIKLASEFYKVLKEIRFAEEKLLIAKLVFLSIADRFSNTTDTIISDKAKEKDSISKNDEEIKKTVVEKSTTKQLVETSISQTVVNKPAESITEDKIDTSTELTTETSSKKFVGNLAFKPVTKEILEELKLKGDLSIFVGLSLASVFEQEDKIRIVFDKSKQFSYEVIREKKEEIALLYKNKTGLNREVEIILSNEINDPILERLKLLFGDDLESGK